MVTTFGFSLIWSLFMIFVIVALSCVEIIGITLSPTFGIAPIDMFWLGFSLLGLLTFVNTVRFRPTRQHYTHRVFEALLIFFGLVTVSEWENKVHPGLGDRPVMEFIHDEVVEPVFTWGWDWVYVNETVDYIIREPVNDVEWGSFPELGPPAPYVDDADFPFGIFSRPASDCECWSKLEEHHRQQHHWLDGALYYGFASEEEIEALRADLLPVPVEAEWCPAVRDLARLRPAPR